MTFTKDQEMDNPFIIGSPTTEKEEECADYPYSVEEFGKLQIDDQVVKAFLFNNPVGTFLFTLEKSKKLSIYIIKGYVSTSQLEN